MILRNSPERRTKLFQCAVAGMVLLPPVALAQVTGASGPVGAAIGTAPVPAPDWDVVLVKPAPGCTARLGLQTTTDGVHVSCLTLRALIQIAWAISEPSRVLGTPAWASDLTYAIDAKVAGEDVATFGKQSISQRNRMLQALLRDRFRLNAHLDRRELPVYQLVVAKGGPRLKEATPDEAAKPTLWLRNSGEIDSISMPLHSLPSMLARELDRPVVDKTGLTGNYDFALKFTPAAAAGSDSEDPSIFTAIQEQLGLRLEPARAPIDVLIVDHVEQPSGNL